MLALGRRLVRVGAVHLLRGVDGSGVHDVLGVLSGSGGRLVLLGASSGVRVCDGRVLGSLGGAGRASFVDRGRVLRGTRRVVLCRELFCRAGCLSVSDRFVVARGAPLVGFGLLQPTFARQRVVAENSAHGFFRLALERTQQAVTGFVGVGMIGHLSLPRSRRSLMPSMQMASSASRAICAFARSSSGRRLKAALVHFECKATAAALSLSAVVLRQRSICGRCWTAYLTTFTVGRPVRPEQLRKPRGEKCRMRDKRVAHWVADVATLTACRSPGARSQPRR